MDKNDGSLLDARYVRWQGLSIAQLTVAIGFISGWSAGAVVYGISVLRGIGPANHAGSRGWLMGAIVALLVSSALSFVSVVCRTLDFKLTARKVRKMVMEKRGHVYDRPLTLLSLSSEDYGRLTWVLYSGGVFLFAIGMTILSITIGLNLDIVK